MSAECQGAGNTDNELSEAAAFLASHDNPSADSDSSFKGSSGQVASTTDFLSGLVQSQVEIYLAGGLYTLAQSQGAASTADSQADTFLARDVNPAADATWADGWRYVRRNLPQYKSVGSTLVRVDSPTTLLLHKAGIIALIFIVYSARIFIIPLWRMEQPYIPVICPIYGEGIFCRVLCIWVLILYPFLTHSSSLAQVSVLPSHLTPRHHGYDRS